MKILLLGSLISPEEMEKLNNNSTQKASVAPSNYETMLVKGLQENGAHVEAFSIPAVAAYPNSIFKTIPAKREILQCGIQIQWLPFINIQLLKQWTIRRSTKKYIRKWLKENKSEPNKVVLMYSIYPPYSGPTIRLCRKYGCHLSTVIADLPEYMYTWSNAKGLKGMYANHIKNNMLAMQNQCDSYVLFTEKMAARMGVENKPYMVSEGFSDTSIYEHITDTGKYPNKNIVYAGNLSKLYGIRELVDGFMLVQGDYELHFYGSGPDVPYIEQQVKRDNRIKYFGRVSRTETLTALKKSHLIIINKPTADDYSNYSFSSKILECMASGTPVLTTRVGGMPEEYYPYFYFIDDETTDGIAKAISDVLMLPAEERAQFGHQAWTFAKNIKNYQTMTQQIVKFLSQNIQDFNKTKKVP